MLTIACFSEAHEKKLSNVVPFRSPPIPRRILAGPSARILTDILDFHMRLPGDAGTTTVRMSGFHPTEPVVLASGNGRIGAD